MMEVIGIGLRAQASLAAFTALEEQLLPSQAHAIALPEFRAHLPLVAQLNALGRRLIVIPAARLRGQATVTRSPRSLAHYGTGSVAEACALLAWPRAQLVAPARLSSDHMITAALARAPFDVTAERPLA